MDFPDHPFWNFSIKIHQREGVHEACLALQRSYSLNVNLLFFCCWVGASGGRALSRAQMKAAMKTVEGWQDEIVRPIWKARWKLKPLYKKFPTEWTEKLRQRLIKAELDAEHMEQLQLGGTISFTAEATMPEEERITRVVSNIFMYLDLFFQDVPIEQGKDKIVAPLLTLVSACFPDQDLQKLKNIIANRLPDPENVSGQR